MMSCLGIRSKWGTGERTRLVLQGEPELRHGRVACWHAVSTNQAQQELSTGRSRTQGRQQLPQWTGQCLTVSSVLLKCLMSCYIAFCLVFEQLILCCYTLFCLVTVCLMLSTFSTMYSVQWSIFCGVIMCCIHFYPIKLHCILSNVLQYVQSVLWNYILLQCVISFINNLCSYK